MNSVNLIGRVANDVELKHTNSGVSVVSFNLAVSRGKDKNGNEGTDFIPVVIWREYAAMMSKYLVKGQQIGVSGRISTRTYETQNGEKRKAVEIVADSITLLGKKDDAKNNDTDKQQNTVSSTVDVLVDPVGTDADTLVEPIPDFAGFEG
ncbi:MAG: single-stranded DNA-binding protein [Eubacterium sp.]|nr:single-stranded DNA-binding protein [Eubacterium sp.]